MHRSAFFVLFCFFGEVCKLHARLDASFEKGGTSHRWLITKRQYLGRKSIGDLRGGRSKVSADIHERHQWIRWPAMPKLVSRYPTFARIFVSRIQMTRSTPKSRQVDKWRTQSCTQYPRMIPIRKTHSVYDSTSPSRRRADACPMGFRTGSVCTP
jgi:hypothetical protein